MAFTRLTQAYDPTLLEIICCFIKLNISIMFHFISPTQKGVGFAASNHFWRSVACETLFAWEFGNRASSFYFEVESLQIFKKVNYHSSFPHKALIWLALLKHQLLHIFSIPEFSVELFLQWKNMSWQHGRPKKNFLDWAIYFFCHHFMQIEI